jgi:hypothetical protein
MRTFLAPALLIATKTLQTSLLGSSFWSFLTTVAANSRLGNHPLRIS